MSFTRLILQLLASPPLPAWQPGSTWTDASRKQMPFQPLGGGAVRHEGGEQGLGAVLERSSPKAPPWCRRGLPHPSCSRSLGREGANTPPLPLHSTLMMCTLGSPSSIPLLQEQEWQEVMFCLGSSIVVALQGHMVPSML